MSFITVADPGFSPGGGANSQRGCANLFENENERILAPRGGGGARPWRPPLHPPLYNVIHNAIHNAKPLEHYEQHCEWQRSQLGIMNDVVIRNPIPTTWAKLVQNSFAKNANSTGRIICQLKSICCAESSYSYLNKRLASLYHLKPSYLLKKLHRTLADMYLQGCHRNI